MEGHPVVVPNGAARVSKRFRNSTEPRGHGTNVGRTPSSAAGPPAGLLPPRW